MKKEDVLLRMIAISGELPAELVSEVVGSESYAAVLVTKLKKEGFISVRNSGGYKGYILRSKGKKYLLTSYEEDLSFFLSGSAQTNHIKSEPDKRLRLHRMSEVWVYFWKIGIKIFKARNQILEMVLRKVGKRQSITAVWSIRRVPMQSRAPEPVGYYLPGKVLMLFITL